MGRSPSECKSDLGFSDHEWGIFQQDFETWHQDPAYPDRKYLSGNDSPLYGEVEDFTESIGAKHFGSSFTFVWPEDKNEICDIIYDWALLKGAEARKVLRRQLKMSRAMVQTPATLLLPQPKTSAFVEDTADGKNQLPPRRSSRVSRPPWRPKSEFYYEEAKQKLSKSRKAETRKKVQTGTVIDLVTDVDEESGPGQIKAWRDPDKSVKGTRNKRHRGLSTTAYIVERAASVESNPNQRPPTDIAAASVEGTPANSVGMNAVFPSEQWRKTTLIVHVSAQRRSRILPLSNCTDADTLKARILSTWDVTEHSIDAVELICPWVSSKPVEIVLGDTESFNFLVQMVNDCPLRSKSESGACTIEVELVMKSNGQQSADVWCNRGEKRK